MWVAALTEMVTHCQHQMMVWEFAESTTEAKITMCGQVRDQKQKVSTAPQTPMTLPLVRIAAQQDNVSIQKQESVVAPLVSIPMNMVTVWKKMTAKALLLLSTE